MSSDHEQLGQGMSDVSTPTDVSSLQTPTVPPPMTYERIILERTDITSVEYLQTPWIAP